MRNWLLEQDAYGQIITLNVKGKDTYKSWFGGIITVIGRALIAYYVVSNLIRLFNNENEYQAFTMFKDVVTNPLTMEIDRENF